MLSPADEELQLVLRLCPRASSELADVVARWNGESWFFASVLSCRDPSDIPQRDCAEELKERCNDAAAACGSWFLLHGASLQCSEFKTSLMLRLGAFFHSLKVQLLFCSFFTRGKSSLLNIQHSGSITPPTPTYTV